MMCFSTATAIDKQRMRIRAEKASPGGKLARSD